MARIKLSSIGITNLVGKAGGSVYSTNKGGAYFKNFVKPSNPRTAAQQLKRSIFGSIASTWRTLTDPQRSNWNQTSNDFPYKDVFGDTKHLSGFGLHQQINSNLMAADLPTTIKPPNVVGVSAIIEETNNAFDIAVPEWVLDFNLTGAMPQAGAIIVEATNQVSKGIANFSGRYRIVYTEAIAAAATTVSLDAVKLAPGYADVFGLPEAKANVGYRVRIVGENGETTGYFYGKMSAS